MAEGLADLLDRGAERIIEQWLARASALLGERLPHPLLLDSLPDLLREVSDALRRGATLDTPRELPGITRISEEHAGQRFRVGLALEQLMGEYRLIREVILDLLVEEGYQPTLEELRILTDVIWSGIGAAVRQYTAEREAARRATEGEARRAGEALARANALLEAALASAPLGFSFVDRELRFVRVNESLARLLGVRAEEAIGRTVREVVQLEAEAVESAHRQVLESGAPVLSHEVSGNVSGATRDWLVSYYPVRPSGSDVEYVGAVVLEITERRRVERQLHRMREFEQQLIGIVSHDLRSPLHTILLAAALLLRSPDLPEREKRTARQIEAAAERASRLIRDLLDLTRGRLGGGIPIERRATVLGDVVRSTLDELRPAAPGRELAVTVVGDTRGSWDPDRLAQVVTNLVSNAVRYSPEGSPVKVTVAGTDGEVRLEVHNEGPPIPGPLLPRIFEPLRRATQTERGGLGLGLYIVEQIVTAHRGRVSVDTDAERGTTFAVVLPRVPGEAAGPAGTGGEGKEGGGP